MIPVLWLLASMVLLGAVIGTCISHAAPPETPQQDGRFLFTLGEVGIGYGNASQAIVAGHEVCNLLDAGGSVDMVVDVLERTTSLDRSWSMLFARISIQAYCGRHGDALRPHKGGSGTRVLGVIA